jgi:hypothetical protein
MYTAVRQLNVGFRNESGIRNKLMQLGQPISEYA